MEFIVSGCVTLLFFILAYLIWGKKKLFFIAGYEEGGIKDKDKLARYMGIFLIIFGISIFFIPFINGKYKLFYSLATIPYIIGFIVFVNIKVK